MAGEQAQMVPAPQVMMQAVQPNLVEDSLQFRLETNAETMFAQEDEESDVCTSFHQMQ